MDSRAFALLLFVAGATALSAHADELPIRSETDAQLFSESEPKAGAWGMAGYPILFYSPETKTALGGGATVYRKNAGLRPDVSEIELFATQNRQVETNLKQTTFFSGNRFELSGEFRLNRSPNLEYYGVGADSPTSAKETYMDRTVAFAPRFTVQIWKDFFVGPAFRVAIHSAGQLGQASLIDSGPWPGGREATLVGAGLTTRLDTTDSPFFATRGLRSEATALLYNKGMGSDYGFLQARLSHCQYFRLGVDQVLAFQVLATLSAGDVPWQGTHKLGGMTMLRGYYEGRYRDRQFLAAQVEYRFPVWWRLSGATFASVGEVSHSLSGLFASHVRASAGGGLRLLMDRAEHINLRVDVAATISGAADFYISLMEAF